jgi:hypothetical protein
VTAPTLMGLTAVTLFCGRGDQSGVVTSLEMPGLALESRAPESYEARGPSGSMTLAMRVFAPGSKFAHTILGAHNAVRNAPGEEAAKSRVLHLLETCDLMVGVRLSPALGDESDERVRGLLEAARCTEGLLFDGFAFLDSELTPIVQVA